MRIFLIICFATLFSNTNAVLAQAKYSKVKIDLTQTEIREIAALGLEADHGEYARGRHLINDFSQREILILKQNNIKFEILIDDVQAYYVAQNSADHAHHHHHGQSRDGHCENNGAPNYNYTTPANYTYGSMGGYHTYSQLLDVLDSMARAYPDLITVREPIANKLTHEGNPIYWIKVSDNVAIDEDEPEVLYTALHHAREPNSLSQMIFFLWYMLENYETNAEIKYLVDNTAMYFIPCVNPDGYLYNEETNPDGGGLWRKNRWAQEDSIMGVDLNRNYGYEWGFDDIGSSIFPESATFRGEEPFSEPESQAVRDFCIAHDFKIAHNYHSFGNLLIYPWGYSDSATPDHETFVNMAAAMTRENNYLAGTASQTVGYAVNGTSDDWFYGEQTTKPKIFSYTPEVGDRPLGFWPPQSQIDRLNKSALRQNIVTAHLLHNYAEVEEKDPTPTITTIENTLELELIKYGLTSGTITASVNVISDNATITNGGSLTLPLDHLDRELFTTEYTVDDNTKSGDKVVFVVSVDNMLYTTKDTLTKTFLDGNPQTLAEDMASNLISWDTNEWDVTTSDFFSAPSCITDSPEGMYEGNQETELKYRNPISLIDKANARLSFRAKWTIEEGYDYAQVMVRTTSSDYVPLCGLYTVAGTNDQDAGMPLYDGNQNEWVLEEIDLSNYEGEVIFIKFRMVSDAFVELDGFYVDDLKITAYDNLTSVSETVDNINVQVYPNPVTDDLNVEYYLTEKSNHLELSLYDALGKQVVNNQLKNQSIGRHASKMNTSTLNSGIYFLQLQLEGQTVLTQKVTKL